MYSAWHKTIKNSRIKMKIITADSFGSVHMLIFYVVMNSLYKINQVSASVTTGSAGTSSNGKWRLSIIIIGERMWAVVLNAIMILCKSSCRVFFFINIWFLKLQHLSLRSFNDILKRKFHLRVFKTSYLHGNIPHGIYKFLFVQIQIVRLGESFIFYVLYRKR